MTFDEVLKALAERGAVRVGATVKTAQRDHPAYIARLIFEACPRCSGETYRARPPRGDKYKYLRIGISERDRDLIVYGDTGCAHV